MFGLTFSGVLVYMFPRFFSDDRLAKHLVTSCLLFSLFAVLTLFLVLNYHHIPKKREFSPFPLSVLTVGTSLPFIFAGLALSLALTHLRREISRVYFSDLVGSGIGCMLTIIALGKFGGPGAVFFISCIGAFGAVCFAVWGNQKIHKTISIIVLASLLILCAANTVFDFVTVNIKR